MCPPTHLRAVSYLTSISVADVDLPVADSMWVRGVTLNRRLTFDDHASAVARSCNYHARAIRHIRRLLTLDLAQTLTWRLILWRIDYCNSVLYDAPSCTIQKLQRAQNKRRVSFRERLDVYVHICPGARCSTATWSLTLSLSSKTSNCGDIIRCTVYICVCIWNVF